MDVYKNNNTLFYIGLIMIILSVMGVFVFILRSNYSPQSINYKKATVTVTTSLGNIISTTTYTKTQLQPQGYEDIRFSPKGGCADLVIYWINRANKSIHILIFSFTYQPIADALITQARRGIEVKILFEKDQLSKYSMHTYIKNAGTTSQLKYDSNSAYMHDKLCVIDSSVIITGSFNWSNNAENNNNENLLAEQSPYLAEKAEQHFMEVWQAGITL